LTDEPSRFAQIGKWSEKETNEFVSVLR